MSEDTKLVVAGAAAVAVAIGVWIGENALIEAAGYSGFAGAGWVTAIVIPVSAAYWAFMFVASALGFANDEAEDNSSQIQSPSQPTQTQPLPPPPAQPVQAQPVQAVAPPATDDDFEIVIKSRQVPPE